MEQMSIDYTCNYPNRYSANLIEQSIEMLERENVIDSEFCIINKDK